MISSLRSNNDLKEGCQFKLVKKEPGTALIARTYNSQRITRRERYKHFLDSGDKNENPHRARSTTIEPIHCSGNLIVHPKRIGNSHQKIAGSLGPHHQTPGRAMCVAISKEKFDWTEDAFELLDEQVIGVAQGTIHIKTDGPD